MTQCGHPAMQAVVRSTSHNHTQVLDRHDHSALMLAARITLPHFSVSSAMSFAKAALSLKLNKTDANDAFGLAQIMRVGWYREVTVKGLDCQAVRALLVAQGGALDDMTRALDKPRPQIPAPLARSNGSRRRGTAGRQPIDERCPFHASLRAISWSAL